VLVHVRTARRGLRSDCAPAKERAIPKTEGLFTVGIEHGKGSLPDMLDRTSSPRDRCSGVAGKRDRAFFNLRSLPGADGSKHRLSPARLVDWVSVLLPTHQSQRPDGFYDSSAFSAGAVSRKSQAAPPIR
jgi:hypothetical protein